MTLFKYININLLSFSVFSDIFFDNFVAIISTEENSFKKKGIFPSLKIRKKRVIRRQNGDLKAYVPKGKNRRGLYINTSIQ
ncbi:hypothetical protein SAMN05444672_12280 [Bacillus sp. OK838]|nr:hypothetical protein SAMN05444672_12280 [Bacillus sp. OK838]